jgi:hypothetical protein
MKDQRTYSRTFETQVRQRDVSRHGSPVWEEYSGENDESVKLKGELENNFLLQIPSQNPPFSSLSDELYLHQSKEILTKVRLDNTDLHDKATNYQMKIFLERQGDDLSKQTSLEDFLLKNDFKSV